jgi:hypothetical protein
MTTTSRPDGLKFRWWQALQANPPKWPVWRESSGLMFAVAMALHGYASVDGSAIFPSATTLGTLVGVSRNTVQKYRAQLVELNMLERVKRGKGRGSASEYRLCEPGQWRDLDREFEAAMSEEAPRQGPTSIDETEQVRAWLEQAKTPEELSNLNSRWRHLIDGTPLSFLVHQRFKEFGYR